MTASSEDQADWRLTWMLLPSKDMIHEKQLELTSVRNYLWCHFKNKNDWEKDDSPVEVGLGVNNVNNDI